MKPGAMLEKGQVWFKNKWVAAKKVAANGCTGIPDLGQTPCCNQHDANYSAGSAVSRLSADMELMACIIFRAAKYANVSVPKALFYMVLAPVFFIGVRLFGWMFYQKEKKK